MSKNYTHIYDLTNTAMDQPAINKKKKLKLTDLEFEDFKKLESELLKDSHNSVKVNAAQFGIIMKMLRCVYENNLKEE